MKNERLAALADVFYERLETPFIWGKNDCCLFAADCAFAATGVDPAEKFRGTYDDAVSALRLTSKLGGMENIAAISFGPEISPALASFGDIGLIENFGRPCLAVYGGEYFHAPGEDGLKIFPVEQCLRAWRLPE